MSLWEIFQLAFFGLFLGGYTILAIVLLGRAFWGLIDELRQAWNERFSSAREGAPAAEKITRLFHLATLQA